MALKTQPTDQDVRAYLEAVAHPQRRDDAFTLLEMMEAITGESAVMWGDDIVGFGQYDYRYASGHEGSWFMVGFAPRKSKMTVYVLAGFEAYPDLMAQLGKHKTGKSCLYINKLADVDLTILRALIAEGYKYMQETNHISESP